MNRAAELGPACHRWWLDWRGECVAIVACGPSAKGTNLEILRDRIHVIAIKEAHELCPWADVVYGCDAPWWLWKEGLPGYKGTKITYAMQAANKYRDLRRVEIKHNDKILLDEPAVIGSGGNSGFQAINIAVQFGATGIALIGFDCTDRSGPHFYGRNNWPNANNPGADNFQRWLRAFNAVAPDLKRLGVEVVNTAEHTALHCFERKPLAQTLQGWGL